MIGDLLFNSDGLPYNMSVRHLFWPLVEHPSCIIEPAGEPNYGISHNRQPVAIRRPAQCRYLFTCSHHVLVVCGGTRWESVCVWKIGLIYSDTKDNHLTIASRLNPCTSSVKSTTTLVETSKDREMARWHVPLDGCYSLEKVPCLSSCSVYEGPPEMSPCNCCVFAVAYSVSTPSCC